MNDKDDLESPEQKYFHDIKLNGKPLRDCELVYKSDCDNIRLYVVREEHGFNAHAVQYESCSYGLNEEHNKINQWENKNLVVETLFEITAYWDGVRHLSFNCNNAETDGYLYYPNIADLIAMLQKVREIELQICRET